MSDERDEAIRRRAKLMMRKRFRGHRQALPPAGIAQRSAAICERLLQLPAVRQARQLASFWPMLQRKEVDLRPLHQDLRARGCSLWYPRADMETGAMSFHRLDDAAELLEGPFGTREPPADAPAAEQLDVVIVPGLAFDGSGGRIGYGGGFYDRALPRWCPPARAIGVAYDFQLAADIPTQPWDTAVDAIVTDARMLEVALYAEAGASGKADEG